MEQKKLDKMQARLNHYFRRVRSQFDLDQKEMADQMGYSHTTYRRFESSALTDNKIINAIQALHHVAGFDNISAGELVSYLEKGNVRGVEGGKKLRSWEAALLQALSKIDLKLRREWTDAVFDSRKASVKEILELMRDILKLKPKEIIHIRGMVDCLLDRD